MQYIVHSPSTIKEKINIPPSKSISNRALIINALAGNKEMPVNVSACDDTLVTIAALNPKEKSINIGAAGTAMRFLTAYLSVTPGLYSITGTERMKHRPIKILVDSLRKLGAEIEYIGEEGFPPLAINGKNLTGGQSELAGNVSSQYISALLMIGPMLERGLEIKLTGEIVSRPYIDMTLTMMKSFGADVAWIGEDRIKVSPKQYNTESYYVENDWSGASYWYEAMALLPDPQSEIVLPGLFENSAQGDSRIKDFFLPLGVKTEFRDGCVVLSKKEINSGILELDLTCQPDLAQTLVVTCAMLGKSFRFTGLQSLKIKETDRIEALRTELKKLGYLIGEKDGKEMFWNGKRCEKEPEAEIKTYEDHRMAMAFAPCCITLGKIRINNPEVVSKSYPKYWEDLSLAGFKIEKNS